MYYDKDLKTLDTLVTQIYNLVDVIKTRRELDDVVQISSSVFTRINTERYKQNHPEMFYAFRLDDIIVQGVKEHGLYFVRVSNCPYIINDCVPLESPLTTQVSIKKLKTVDDLGTLFRTIVKNLVEDKVTPRELF